MDVNEVKKKKSKLELELSLAISKFQMETGMIVQEVRYSPGDWEYMFEGGSGPEKVQVSPMTLNIEVSL